MGRFAPSPTGLLHMGSLMAAVASYLDAKSHQGRWLLRIEDLDPPRELSGAADDFVRTLTRFGFEWDGDIVFQSQRGGRYQEVLNALLESGLVYRCACTRKMLHNDGLFGVDGFRYIGRCRDLYLTIDEPCAYRIRVPDENVEVLDRVQGVIKQNLKTDLGDFVIRRADSYWAYQLAVVVDDADSGVTHIVRGADLLDSTPRQRYLQKVLNFALPAYLHIPVIANESGEKLSKQTLAPVLRQGAEVEQLWTALTLLWQRPPEELKFVGMTELWAWALKSWDVGLIPEKRSVAVTVNEKNEFKFL